MFRELSQLQLLDERTYETQTLFHPLQQKQFICATPDKTHPSWTLYTIVAALNIDPLGGFQLMEEEWAQ